VSDARLAAIEARLAAGDAQGARAAADVVIAEATLASGDRVRALVLRSRAHEALRALPLAIVDLDGALALDPSQARLWNELGILCADSGQVDRAIDAFARATRADPRYARAWNNLGNALRSAGRIAEAVQAAQRAVDADPSYALAWANLGALCRQAGDDAAAEAALRRALALDPRQRGAIVTLAGLLHERSDLGPAVDLFARAAALDPRDANAACELGQALAERDDLAGARAAYFEAERRDPRMLRALLARALTLPMVYGSAAALADARASYADGLALLERDVLSRIAGVPPERVIDELRFSNFLLAYQGEDDLALQRRYGAVADRIVRAGAPEWALPLPARRNASGKIKVGFASSFFRDGTAGRYFEHWITDLPRERFEVFVYHLLPGTDALAQRLAARADHFRHCAWWRPSQLAPRIRADALDALVYPELGMSAVTFALAALRLAPLQCAAWGHPVTTGLATVDVYFSSAVMEPADAAAHYSERLLTLPGIGTRYGASSAPGDATRERFGLPDGVPLLLCPQSLFKIHPDNDALFARVLAESPHAILVGFEGRDPHLTAEFRARLAGAGIAGQRLRLLPQCGHEDYLRVNTLCDVMLDTLHWSGGNTSLDALACGLPIVTLPGRFMRGRQSAGMLALMEIRELIAADQDDYVRKVAKIASDRPHRDALSARIAQARAGMFDDGSAIAALHEFLERSRG
jgi:CRISPR-associated protein Csy1